MSIAQILIQPTTPDIIIVRHGDTDDNDNDSLAGSFNSEEAPSTAHTTPHKDTPMILNGRARDHDEQEEEEEEEDSSASTTTNSSNDTTTATQNTKTNNRTVTMLPAPEEAEEEEEGKRSPTLMLDDADEAIQPSEGEISPNSAISEGNNTQRHHQASFNNNGSFPDVCGGGCLSDNDTSMSAPVSPALVISQNQLPASARPPCRPHVTPADIEQQRAEIIRNRKASLDQWVAEHEDAATFAVPADIRILTLLREGHRHEQAMLDKRIQALEKAHAQEMNTHNQEEPSAEEENKKKNELRRKVLRQSYKNIIIDAGKRLRNAAVSKKLAPPQVQKMASDGITCYSTMFPWNEGIHGDAIIQLEPALSSSSRPGSAPASPACARPMGRAPPRNGATTNNSSSSSAQPPRPTTGTSSPPPQQPPRCTPLACLTLENRRAELAQRRRAERIREWAAGRQQQQQRTTGKK